MCHREFLVAGASPAFSQSCQSWRSDARRVCLLLLRRSLLSVRPSWSPLSSLPELCQLGFGASALLRRPRPGPFSLRLFLRKLGSLELCPSKAISVMRTAVYVLPVSAQLLVLLLAFVVEDQNLGAASLFDDLADHARFGLRTHQSARRRRDGQHVAEFDFTVCAVAPASRPESHRRAPPVLLATSADDRVHNSPPPSRRGGQPGPPGGARLRCRTHTCACCFPAAAFDRKRGADPERARKYGKLN